jgi:hypothetical protein
VTVVTVKEAYFLKKIFPIFFLFSEGFSLFFFSAFRIQVEETVTTVTSVINGYNSLIFFEKSGDGLGDSRVTVTHIPSPPA